MARKADKFIQAQALGIITNYHQAIDFAVEDILYEIHANRIEGESAFAYAKEEIRRQGIKEGMNLLRQKLTKYAEHQ
jgi:hypothetical protein